MTAGKLVSGDRPGPRPDRHAQGLATGRAAPRGTARRRSGEDPLISRDQLEHAIRTVCQIIGAPAVIIEGSHGDGWTRDRTVSGPAAGGVRVPEAAPTAAAVRGPGGHGGCTKPGHRQRGTLSALGAGNQQLGDQVEVICGDVAPAGRPDPLKRLLPSADEPEVDVQRQITRD